MKKSELISRISAKIPNLTIREVSMIVDAMFDKISEALINGDRVEIRGFGSFSTRKRKPRVAVNPKSKKRIEVPSRNMIHFKTGKDLHIKMNS